MPKPKQQQPKATTPKPGRRKRVGRIALLALFSLLLFAAGGWWRLDHRPQPTETRRVLFQGITYTREVQKTPRPIVIHVVTIDLNAPRVAFLVTPGDPTQARPLRARLTSQFLSEFHLQLAINGDFFYPWWSRALWDYYPHVGDSVDVEGFASSRGSAYMTDERKRARPALLLSRDNRASIGRPVGTPYNAISGIWQFLRDGKFQHCFKEEYTDRQPRTAAALDRAARRLILILVDGRQPNYSEGMTLYELAQTAQRYRGWTAINLDGGGSSTLVIADKNGHPQILNSPIDNHIPGRERPVANHLGVFARALD